MSAELPKAYRQATHEEKATFTKEVRENLLGGVPIAIRALLYEAEHSKNSAARVAAARQLIRMAYVAGVLERDAIKDFMDEFTSEFANMDKDLGLDSIRR